MDCSALERSLDELSCLLSCLEAAELSGSEAAGLTERLCRAANAIAAARTRCARRVAETRQFEGEGHKDAASWLASASGDSRSAAERSLRLGAAVESLPELAESFARGEVSQAQAAEVARGAAAHPFLLSELLQKARAGSLGELREETERILAAAASREDQKRRAEAVRAKRHLRTWKDRDGGLAGRFLLPGEDGAHLLGRIEQLAGALFEQAREEGDYDRREAYLADALVLLARAGEEAPPAGPAPTGEPPGPPGSPPAQTRRRETRPDYTIIMRIDLEALVRGYLERGEESSIDGTGHVPVEVVKGYLDKAKLRLVVTKGSDISSVFSLSRVIPSCLRTALVARDRTCVVPGCQSSFLLEIDHILEFSRGGPTTLSNLCRLCHYHHRLKSRGLYRIEGRPGSWRWVRASEARGRPHEPARNART